MAMEENQKKAFDFAADLTKQLITLSTAIITLTVTFSKDIIGGAQHSFLYLLIGIWAAYILSILFGLSTLGALTGNLDPKPIKRKDSNGNLTITPAVPILTVTDDNVTSTSKLQIFTFIFALVLTCIYGCLSVCESTKVADHKGDYIIIRESSLSTEMARYIDTIYVPRK